VRRWRRLLGRALFLAADAARVALVDPATEQPTSSAMSRTARSLPPLRFSAATIAWPSSRRRRLASVSWSFPSPSGPPSSAGLRRARPVGTVFGYFWSRPEEQDALGRERARSAAARGVGGPAPEKESHGGQPGAGPLTCGGRRREGPGRAFAGYHPAEGPALRHLQELEGRGRRGRRFRRKARKPTCRKLRVALERRSTSGERTSRTT